MLGMFRHMKILLKTIISIPELPNVVEIEGDTVSFTFFALGGG
jgi:hypothetical protein